MKLLLSGIAAALMAALLAGPGTSQPATAADAYVVRIVTSPIDQVADVFYAEEEGFFKKAGLNVEITLLDNGPAIIAAVSAGAADIGAVNVGSIAVARERGLPMRLIGPASIHRSSVSVDMLMVGTNSTIRSARDLAGKTIAVNAIGALPNIATKAWIAQNGGDVATVHFVEMPFPAMAQALAGGRVDAATMSEPFITASKGITRVLADAYDTIGKEFVVSGWVATDPWIAAHPDEAAKFASAMRRAHEWANTHQAQSAEISARHTKMTLEVLRSVTRVVFGTTLDPAFVQPVLDTFASSGALPKPMAASEIIWTPAGSARSR